MATEKLEFTIELSIQTHEGVKENPFVNISVNGYPQFGEILKEDKTVNFVIELQDNTQHTLTIEYLNKDFRTDVVLGEDGLPFKDKTVTIESIAIESINLNLEEKSSEDYFTYTTIDEGGENSKGHRARYLSWNGTTKLEFNTPVYVWLLENL